MSTTKISLFKGRKIRKILCENEWWFSVIDVVAALADSMQSSKYRQKFHFLLPYHI